VAVLTSSWLLNSVFARDLSRRSASRVGGEPFLQRSSQRIDRRLILRFLSAFRDDPNAPSKLYQLDLIGGRVRSGLVLIHSLPAIRHKESLWSYVHAILHILIGSVSRISPWFAMSRSRCSLDFVRRRRRIFPRRSLGLGPLKACILSRSRPLLHRLGPWLALHLLVGHGVGGRIECVM
jgi:hypothetical protein